MEADKVLVRQILQGEAALFESLINKYYLKVKAFIRKMGFSREDAEDMTQEVFLKVYNNLYRYDERWNFSTWLFQIAVNTYRNHIKAKKYDRKKMESAVVYPVDISPEEHLLNTYQYEVVLKAIKSLDEKGKGMLILHYYNGFALKEIGRIYGISTAAVKMKLFRARTKLAGMCRSEDMGGVLNEVQL